MQDKTIERIALAVRYQADCIKGARWSGDEYDAVTGLNNMTKAIARAIEDEQGHWFDRNRWNEIAGLNQE